MKILHTADWHLGKRLDHISRLEEQKAVLEEICEIAEGEDVDAVLIAGDLFDNANPPIEAIELFYKTLRRLAAGGQRAVIGIAGNHDAPDRIAAPDPLARASGIILMGYPAETCRELSLETGLKVLRSGEGWVELQLPRVSYPLRLVLTPYANNLRLRKAINPEDAEQSLLDALQAHWAAAAAACCDPTGVNILMTHLLMMNPGGERPEESEDERTILTPGGLQEVPTHALPDGLDYVALGHLHRPQTITEQPCPVVYSGSPLAYSMSEAGQQKSVVLLNLEPGNLQRRRIPIQAGKTLVRKRFADIDDAVAWLEAHPETLVELTLETAHYLTAKDRQRVFKAHAGIVALIPLITDQEAFALKGEDIDPTQDMESLFRGYFQYRQGQPPNEELMDIFRELLGD